MVRAKTSQRKVAKPKKADSDAGPSSAPDAASLIERAHILLAQSNFELAIQFLQRACTLEPANTEARELLGVAELEEGDPDVGRQHLLMLLPPHADSPPSTPAPYLYLAQSAEDPHESLGYYSTAAAMVENSLRNDQGVAHTAPGSQEEAVSTAVRCLVAMIEIWMSDLCMEEEAERNCDALISRALSIAPEDHEVQLTLASIRMSQSREEEAKAIAVKLCGELEGKEPFDESLPALPTRLALARLLLEHNLHLEALNILSTAREEDELNVEAAYLEGWAWHLRAEALIENPSLRVQPQSPTEAPGETDEDGPESMSSDECFSEAMRALLETAKLFAEQDYPDEGIGLHTADLLDGLQKRGVQPAVTEEQDEEMDGDEGAWEGVEMA